MENYTGLYRFFFWRSIQHRWLAMAWAQAQRRAGAALQGPARGSPSGRKGLTADPGKKWPGIEKKNGNCWGYNRQFGMNNTNMNEISWDIITCCNQQLGIWVFEDKCCMPRKLQCFFEIVIETRFYFRQTRIIWKQLSRMGCCTRHSWTAITTMAPK